MTSDRSVDESDKWKYVLSLDEKYLLGGVLLSEWTTRIARDADTAYRCGANLAAILSAQAAVECHLRYEFAEHHVGSRLGFFDLIEQSPLSADLKRDLHKLRRFRNKWVHVNDPRDDAELLEQPDANESELERTATETMEVLRKSLYLEQLI